MKKLLFGLAFVATMIVGVFAIGPYYTTRAVWSNTVVETTSTFSIPDNVYVKDITLINLSTGVVTFGIKASSAILTYVSVGMDGRYVWDCDEVMKSVVVHIDTTHISSNTWTVTMSSVNKIGVIYRYK